MGFSFNDGKASLNWLMFSIVLIRKEIEIYMEWALEIAKKAPAHADVPVGALVVDENGFIIGQGKNERELRQVPEAHAEVLALSSAARKRKNWNLSGCQLIVTLEPCLMCSGLIVQSRIEKVWFGAFDPKGGSLVSNYGVAVNNLTNHPFEVEGGILEEKSAFLLRNFFQELRREKRAQAQTFAEPITVQAP